MTKEAEYLKKLLRERHRVSFQLGDHIPVAILKQMHNHLMHLSVNLRGFTTLSGSDCIPFRPCFASAPYFEARLWAKDAHLFETIHALNEQIQILENGGTMNDVLLHKLSKP